jgi:hypothetical protein
MVTKDFLPLYRIVSQDENSIQIEYQTECENCGSKVDYYYLMILGWREKPILYNDEGYFCSKCGLKVERQHFGIPSREVSHIFQTVEGVWFLTMILLDQNARNELKATRDVEFADNRFPFELFQATATDFIITGAHLEMRYIQQILTVKNIVSNLLPQQDWLAQQKRLNDE